MQKLKNKNQGFTIIEVVLVLAIAGLIFLIVFLALPRLQKSRRDTQRKNDLGTVISQLENYAGNNNGTYPNSNATMQSFKNTYAGSLKDPSSGGVYNWTYGTGDIEKFGYISYLNNAKCNGTGIEALGSEPNKFAVSVYLESGGVYCKDNNQ